MRRKYSIFLLCLFTSWGLSAQAISPFNEGERVVFLGNSITDGGRYHSYIWLYYMTRFPNLNVRMVNAGIGGDTAYDMDKRFDADVMTKKPTTLVVTFGMNDTGYFEYNGENPGMFGEEKFQETKANFHKLEARLQQLDSVKVIMMGGSPYDETAKIEGNTPFKGKNTVMQRVVTLQQQSAQNNGWEFLDLNQPMVAINNKLQTVDSTFTLCGPDRIHPENDGHMVMAYLFLKEQTGNEKPGVATVKLNASDNSVLASVNCNISHITRYAETLSFDYLAGSLPYPLDTIPRGWNARKSQADALNYVPFIEEMNREMLQVVNLESGDYHLRIDGEDIGIWSSEELHHGINLAVETKTPQYQQALAIMYLNELRWEIERNFRDYAWLQFNFFQARGLLYADNREAMDSLFKEKSQDPWLGMHWNDYVKMMHKPYREIREAEMELIISTIYEINKPRTRRIEVIKM